MCRKKSMSDDLGPREARGQGAARHRSRVLDSWPGGHWHEDTSGRGEHTQQV